MKLGYNEGTCMKASTVELDLVECEKNGYDYIELRIELLQDYLMRYSLDDLKEFFETHHLKPYSINSIENINFQTPETWSRLVEDFTFQCEVAEAIGITYIVVCPTVGSVMASKKENEIIADTVEMLGELAEKNLRLNEKLTHMGQRTTRAKLMSYFSAEAQRRGGYEFDIPFSRQQLADYLGVERSGLSLELGKMRDEGLLDFHKSHFLLKAPETDGLPPSAR